MLGITWILVYIVLGGFVGFMGGLLGVGGGGILVPLLASIFVYQGIGGSEVVHLSLGTSLMCMIISAIASVRAHASRDAVVWKVVGGMAPGTILGALLVTQVAANLKSSYIALFMAFFMALVAVQMFANWKPKPSLKPMTFRGLLTVGVAIGAVSALAAVGGGFLTVTYLSYKNIVMKRAIGTSAAIGLPIAISGTIGYMISGWSKTLSVPYTIGFIYLPAFLAISMASFIAAPYGARCSHHLPDAYLKKIFAVISLILSLTMVISFVKF